MWNYNSALIRNSNNISKWKYTFHDIFSHLKINFHFTINLSNYKLSPICIDSISYEITAKRFFLFHSSTLDWFIKFKKEEKSQFLKITIPPFQIISIGSLYNQASKIFIQVPLESVIFQSFFPSQVWFDYVNKSANILILYIFIYTHTHIYKSLIISDTTFSWITYTYQYVYYIYEIKVIAV